MFLCDLCNGYNQFSALSLAIFVPKLLETSIRAKTNRKNLGLEQNVPRPAFHVRPLFGKTISPGLLAEQCTEIESAEAPAAVEMDFDAHNALAEQMIEQTF